MPAVETRIGRPVAYSLYRLSYSGSVCSYMRQTHRVRCVAILRRSICCKSTACTWLGNWPRGRRISCVLCIVYRNREMRRHVLRLWIRLNISNTKELNRFLCNLVRTLRSQWQTQNTSLIFPKIPSMHGATAPSEPCPPSKGASVLLYPL